MEKLVKKLKSKNGNSFLFMPYFVTFGVMLMYIIMEMGTAYVRRVELQTITDATARAGIYGGMTGSGAIFTLEGSVENFIKGNKYHIYVNLDDGMATTLANEILLANINNLGTISLKDDKNGKTLNNINDGQLLITKIIFCEPNTSSTIYSGSPNLINLVKNKKVPIWNKSINWGDGAYQWTEITRLESTHEVMASGNFFVAIEGEYKPFFADTILGKNSLTLDGFASALATAVKK